MSERDTAGGALRLTNLPSSYSLLGLTTALTGSAGPYANYEFSRLGKALASAIGELQDAVIVLALGIDFRRWSRFIGLAPMVIEMQPGQLNRTEWHRETPPTQDECRFCYDFGFIRVFRG